MEKFLNVQSIEKQIENFGSSGPFDDVVIENFFEENFLLNRSQKSFQILIVMLASIFECDRDKKSV